MEQTDNSNNSSRSKTSDAPYAEYFGNVRILGDLLSDGAERAWMSGVPADAPHHKYVVWLGCQVLRTVHLAETLTDILTHLSVDHVTLGGPSNCCGIIHHLRGDVAVGEKMTRQTVKKFDAFSPEQLLYWCPSCDNHLRQNGDSFSTPTTRGRRSVVGFLAESLTVEKLALDVPLRVALHSHRGFDEQDQDDVAVRRIFSMIPKLQIVDVAAIQGIGRHCSDSTVKKYGDARYHAAMREWIREAKRAGADSVVSLYHSCHRNLVQAQLDDPVGERIEVENYLTLIARSLGLRPHEDRFAQFTTMENVEQIMERLSGRIQEIGINPEQARRAIQAHFGPRGG